MNEVYVDPLMDHGWVLYGIRKEIRIEPPDIVVEYTIDIRLPGEVHKINVNGKFSSGEL